MYDELMKGLCDSMRAPAAQGAASPDLLWSSGTTPLPPLYLRHRGFRDRSSLCLVNGITSRPKAETTLPESGKRNFKRR